MTDIRDMTIDDLIENLEDCFDWDDRYKYILELGRALSPLEESAQTEENRIVGCQSNAWMTAEKIPGDQPRLKLHAGSDTQVVQGLIAIVLIAYSGKTAEEIKALDIESLFKRLGIEKHLSPVRGNGLRAMVQTIRRLADDLDQDE